MKTAIVIDDHPSARQLLITILEDVIPGIIVSEAATCSDARSMIKAFEYDLAIVDISLPDGSGLDLVTEIRLLSEASYIVMCTIYNDDLHIFDALQKGANGYLVKDQSRHELTQSFKGMLIGHPPLQASVARRILEHFHTKKTQDIPLSTRLEEVLKLLAQGYTRREAAEQLGITENTVADHIKSIYRKLNISNRSEAAREALRRGLIG